jgi:hypothetical protein
VTPSSVYTLTYDLFNSFPLILPFRSTTRFRCSPSVGGRNYTNQQIQDTTALLQTVLINWVRG